MEHQEEVIEQVDTNTYKCPECGAPMRYNPETSSLHCDYCSRIINLEKDLSNEEVDFFSAESDNLSWQNETQIIKCESCGSENVVSKKEMSTVCPFCGSKQVVSYDAIAGIKPNRVIPFKLSLDDAKLRYQTVIKKKLFAPRKLKKTYLDLMLNGVYIPSWTYDSSTFSTYSGRLGKRYTVTVGSGKNRRTETRIRWFSIRGTKNVDFDDVLVNFDTLRRMKTIQLLAKLAGEQQIFLFTHDLQDAKPVYGHILDLTPNRLGDYEREVG